MKNYRLEELLSKLENYKETGDQTDIMQILAESIELLFSRAIIVSSCEDCLYNKDEICLISKARIDKKPIASFCKLGKVDRYFKLIEEVSLIEEQNLY